MALIFFGFYKFNLDYDRNFKIEKKINRPLAQLLSAHAIGAEGLRFKSRVGLVGTVSPTARFFRSCVAQALSHGDGPRHSLHASA